MFDCIIRNGRIMDGTGNPWFRGDVAVTEGKIAALGALGGAQAAQVVDAKGKVICPGFVDGHSHSDLYCIASPESHQKVLQGYTTEVLGLDGMSVAPIRDEDKPGWAKMLAGLAGAPNMPWNWNSFRDYLDAVDAARPSVNICSYVGLGTIRLRAMGMEDRAPTPAELDEMRTLTAQAMEEGARGVSAGLIYAPSKYQSTEEIVELCKVAAEYGGIFDVHMRNESDFIETAIEEVITIAKLSGIAAQITHFKVRGRDNWGKSPALIERLEQARAEGIDITAAQYPYTAGSTMLHACIPPWYHTRGPEGLLDALRNQRDAVKRDIATRNDWENMGRILGWESIFIASAATEAGKGYEGRCIADIAAGEDRDPVDVLCDILVAEQLAVGMVNFGLSEEDIANIMRYHSVSIITDGLLSGGKPHPRTYASTARVLGRYVREQGVTSMEDAVRKLTSLPATKVGLRAKGLLAVGMDADIVVFDPETVIDVNSYEDPRKHPLGFDYVFVHGQMVVKNGTHTGARPGRTIRR